MDVLYILGRGSKHEDMELRLSLRCLEKNAKGLGRVFIVGNCPEWVKNVIHIPAEDTYQSESNAFQKILKGCKSSISDEFLLMNDDFFMMKEFDVNNYPIWTRGVLEQKNEDDPYSRSINKTREFLLPYSKVPLNYEVHCPIKLNKHRMLMLEDIAESVKRAETGLLCRSLYGNIFNVCDFWDTCIEDTKLRTDEWKEPNKTGCISTSDDCDNILKIIEGKYSNKSRWEI